MNATNKMMKIKFNSFVNKVCLILILQTSLKFVSADEAEDARIIGYLAQNRFLQGKAEIVFLLDRSGSVGAANFEIQKGFVESLLTQVMVDVNATRVAVISYSSDVVRHIDYLRDPKNKCFLSQELLNVNFENSGATNIAAALDEAFDVLQNARPNVNKVVILISDGLATAGGDPVSHADVLKKLGVQVFAFGVGRFIKAELAALVSSGRHIYSCSEFREFKELARKIRGDPHEVSWSGKASTPNCDHLCDSLYKGQPDDPGCCDHSALCSCALLSGMHTCVCGPGHYGLSGLAGHCRACPKGTYKSKTEPADKCTACPPFSTTMGLGSTSIKDCLCKEGYHGNISAAVPCSAAKCPALQAPTNGLVLGECRNTYDSECVFMCEDGFELEDRTSDIRRCRSDGTWTQKSTFCRRIHCSDLLTPVYGRKVCNNARGSPMTVGTTCRFQCLKGFLMQGSEYRDCLPSGLWSGKMINCLANECPIPPALKQGHVDSCKTYAKGNYGDTCVFRCNKGFELHGPRFLMCNEEGRWLDPETHLEERSYCQDVQPPSIQCPGPIKLFTEKGRDYATVSWELPKSVDNSGYPPKVHTVPLNVMPPMPFVIGVSRFQYSATDWSGLSSNCTVTIEIIDREKPMVMFCPSKIEVSSTDVSEIIEWREPVFKDNDPRELHIEKTADSGDSFNIGSHVVHYYATDRAGNMAQCLFDVIVSRTYCPYYPPPTNGAFTCDDWLYGQFCQAYCNDRYDFVQTPAEWYVCNADAQWITDPVGYPIPWPDCAKPSFPSKIRKMLAGFYYAGDCNDPAVQVAIKKQFLNHFTSKFSQLGLCNREGGCTIGKVKVKCGRGEPFERKRRGRRDLRESEFEDKEELEVEFVIEIGAGHELNNTDAVFKDFMETIKNLQWDIEEDLSQDIATQLPASEDEMDDERKQKILEFTDEKTLIQCQPGSVLTDGLCVLCPAGTYYDTVVGECGDCAIGYYQDEEGQMNCKECPEDTSTERLRTRNATDCKGVCAPGTYSASGLQTCTVCPLGTFQDRHGASSCEACPDGSTTSDAQTTSISECKAACEPGSSSESGLKPCDPCPKSHYQPKAGQTKCLECPFPLSTQIVGAKNSTECLDYDPCEGNAVCENDGRCLRVGREASCGCSIGYFGLRCEIDVDECEEKPCLNNGSCENLVGSYRCNCSSGFEGRNCESEIDECLSSPCLNNGTCIDKVDGYLCVCAPGYEGDSCETYVDTCFHDVVCANGGICERSASETESRCFCNVGFAGSDCSVDINDCLNMTCSSHGRCEDGLASYECICAEGYTGPDCELEIDECQISLCHSGSTCEDLIASYRCLCPPGYSGQLCENKLDSDFILAFPEDRPSIASLASVKMAAPMSEATVSMWIQTTDAGRSGTPLSYATAAAILDDDRATLDNALTVSDCSGIQVHVNNEPLLTEMDVADGRWHHVAFAWSSRLSGSWSLYKDCQLQSEGKMLSLQTIPGGGIVVIGQEQDTVGGGFSPLESYMGNIARLNVWNSYFSHSNVSRLCNLDDDIPGKVVAWPDFLSNIKGDVVIIRNATIITEK